MKTKYGPAVVAVLVFLIFFALLLSTAQRTSLAYDEIIYPSAGLLHWKTGDLRWCVEHPPLHKLLSGLPLLLKGVSVPSDLDPTATDAWRAGFRVVFGQPHDAVHLIFLTRLPTIFMAIGLALLVFAWMRRRYGIASATVALAVLCFDPLMIGNGALALDDVFLTGFFLVSYLVFERWLENPTVGWAILGGLLAGAAAMSKFSGVLLIPCCVLLAWIYWKHHRITTGKKFAPSAAVGIVTGLLFALSLYKFNPAMLLEAVNGEHAFPRLAAAPRYLLGDLPSGWNWVYYPVALIIKTPLPLLVLWAMAFGLAWRERKSVENRRNEWFFFIPVLVFLAVLLVSKTGAGLRYFLPAVPFLAMFVGSTFQWARDRKEALAFCLLIVWLAVDTLMTHPYHMAYFNSLIGGSKNGYKWLDGSNQDWGQDLPSLAEAVSREPVRPCLYLGYWGSNDPARWGLAYQDVVSPAIVNRFREDAANPVDCAAEWLVVSAELRHNPSTRDAYAWLNEWQPVAFIGNTLFVYDFTFNREAVKQLAEIYKAMGREHLYERQLQRFEHMKPHKASRSEP